MAKTTITKKPVKKIKPVMVENDPRLAIRRTFANASKLAEAMLAAIEADVKKPGVGGQKKTELDRMFGPRGAIANLHKLMQVLDKLSDQLETLEGDSKKKPENAQLLSREDFLLIEEWLRQS